MQSRYNVNISGGGLSISGSKTRETDDAQGLAPVIPAGKTVTSWVKTDSDTADCNLPSGHGYSSGNFDVFWDGGRRYGVPGTVTSGVERRGEVDFLAKYVRPDKVDGKYLGGEPIWMWRPAA
jgi:hypothetical protein